MCKINFELLEFEHVVEFSKDSTVFAAARDNGNGHLRLFLHNESTGNVYTRNGRSNTWEEILGQDRETVLTRLFAARNNHIPVYKINGSHN